MVTEYGIDWERKFGERWSKMSPDERNMATYMAITEFYQYAREQDKRSDGQDKRFSELPCQDCSQPTTIKVESIKGRFLIWSTVISGVLVLIGMVVVALIK